MRVLEDKKQFQSTAFSLTQYTALDKLMQWPAAQCLGPCHLLRALVTHPHAALTYATRSWTVEGKKRDIVDEVCSLLSTIEKATTATQAVRVLANLFARQRIKKLLLGRYEQVLESLAAVLASHGADTELKLSCVAVLINFAISFSESADYADAKVHALTSIQDMLSSEAAADGTDPACAYRLLVVLGTLAYNDAACSNLAMELEVPQLVAGLAAAATCVSDGNVQAVATELAALFQAQRPRA